ncbi:d-amino acid oxidase [Scheffersomyces coipomensis]|uniref:d-amino acid oxidase n=1 Tax=Scheffersomyces coipomensis TaxID=1788519 RepID=UPI00315CD115
MTKHIDIVIVGAGIIGLSAAYAILETIDNLDYTIHIIAEYGPHDRSNPDLIKYKRYTSPWAGAHFRPFPSLTDQDYYESKLTRLTYEKFKLLSLIKDSSIKLVKGIEFFERDDIDVKNKGYYEDIDQFKVLDERDFPKHLSKEDNSLIKINSGTSYLTWVLNAPHYLQYLYKILDKNDKVRFIQRKLSCLNEVNEIIDNYPIIINSSGKGLQYFTGTSSSNYDDQSYPIRGQTLLIDPPQTSTTDYYLNRTITHQSKDGLWTFIIPRPLNGGIILGGTKQIKDEDESVKQSDTQQLISRGKELFPQLMKVNVTTGEKYFDIKRINVGFRPARIGGFNNSIEYKDVKNKKLNHVLNNYGAGGMGYELSYGAGVVISDNLKKLIEFDNLNSHL